jgi:hypothetical protein
VVCIDFSVGGWVLGNIDTENAFSSNMCERMYNYLYTCVFWYHQTSPGAHCVVISVDYRLGPENLYPAAVEDAEEALFWVRDHGKEELGVNLDKFAVGGSSRSVPNHLVRIQLTSPIAAGISPPLCPTRRRLRIPLYPSLSKCLWYL